MSFSKQRLHQLIVSRNSLLCVGLDIDLKKIPNFLKDQPLQFNKAIIDATREFCVGYKINFAFYEALGIQGWQLLKDTIDYIGNDHFIIADAKRGDIGNTAEMYASAVYDVLKCDAVTVNPYMGKDTVTPFLRDGKFTIALGLTSNSGSQDFQQLSLSNGQRLFQQVIGTVASWSDAEHIMFVLGATHPSEVAWCRDNFPDHFFLVPGVGAQGGNLLEICKAGLNKQGGLLINASRSILYASSGADFAEMAAREAQKMQSEMAAVLSKVSVA